MDRYSWFMRTVIVFELTAVGRVGEWENFPIDMNLLASLIGRSVVSSSTEERMTMQRMGSCLKTSW